MHTKRIAFLALLIMALWTVSASGQVDVASATLKGTLTDQHDEVVPGATVTATSIDKGISRTATTGPEGHFQIPLLPPGVYKIEIEARGFNKVFNENVQLTLGQSLVYDVK
jgi:type 1 fimbria pilin